MDRRPPPQIASRVRNLGLGLGLRRSLWSRKKKLGRMHPLYVAVVALVLCERYVSSCWRVVGVVETLLFNHNHRLS